MATTNINYHCDSCPNTGVVIVRNFHHHRSVGVSTDEQSSIQADFWMAVDAYGGFAAIEGFVMS